MSPSQPNILVPREGETRLLWAIVASGIVHAAAIVAVVVMPGYWPKQATPSVSYTVDLVASAEPAGTNLLAGSAPAKPVAPAAPKPVAPAPPPARAPEAPRMEEPAKPLAVKEKPPVAPPAENARPVEAAPRQPPVKVEAAPAEKADVKLASKTMKPTPVEAKEPAPTRAMAKPTAGKATAAVAGNPTPVAAQTGVVREAGEEAMRDKQIAAAVQRRAQDQKIAEAVQRRAAAAHQTPGSAGAGGSAAGPVSLGQGTGSGGVVEGLDMILYRGQMERRIKENWVWAGEDLALEVKVQFDVTSTGEIQNIRVTGSSGNQSYDASAERAVRAASPLAPPPERYRDLFEKGVEITFRPQDLQS